MSIRIVTAVTRLQAGLLQKGRVVLNHEPEFMVKRVDQVEAVPAPGPTRSGLNGQLVAGGRRDCPPEKGSENPVPPDL